MFFLSEDAIEWAEGARMKDLARQQAIACVKEAEERKEMTDAARKMLSGSLRDSDPHRI